MRGKGADQTTRRVFPGITPAYAGKRVRPWRERHKEGDHPRVCGEKIWPSASAGKPLGSPPRMRGKARLFDTVRHNHRITPAYAGKRLSGLFGCVPGRDHPRVCGEKIRISGPNAPTPGSPPRMRGKDYVRYLNEGKHGITPAYAGKRRKQWTGLEWRWDHPRVCGEKKCWKLWWINGAGSPPRMRGKGPHRRSSVQWSGITPAYAGKRTTSAVICAVVRDHPRVCGEKDSG